MSYIEHLCVKLGAKVDLSKVDADYKGEHESHEHAAAEIEEAKRTLRALQFLMYAENKRALLIVLQGRDAAGKDGTINHVLGAMNPQGCTVSGFKVPSKEEAGHDFLWRYHMAAPEKGQVANFNRSHYEDVLVVRVHSLVPRDVWSQRYDHINAFERMLVENDIHILKFYLHIDPDEQLRRFRARIEDPTRHWKISDGDYAERPFWDDYTAAFEDAIGKCSTHHAPWFIIPSNHKWFRNLAVSKIVTEHLQSLGMTFPPPSVDIEEIKKKYHLLADAGMHGER